MNIFGLEISTGILTIALGTVAVGCASVIRARRYGWNALTAWGLTLVLLVIGLIGAKLLYALENLKADNVFNGMSFFGAVFLIPAGLFAFSKIVKKPFLPLLDYLGGEVPLALAFLRMNCVLNGCCGGRQVMIGTWSFIPPVQIIEVVFDLLLFAALMGADKWAKKRENGILYPLFGLSYGIFRFLIEYWRATPKKLLWGVSIGQCWSILAVLLSVAALILIHKLQAEKPEIK